MVVWNYMLLKITIIRLGISKQHVHFIVWFFYLYQSKLICPESFSPDPFY